jgi:hypothetical protein
MMRDLLTGFLALALCFGGGYFYGKHVEAEAQAAEVARLNTEARQKEQALTTAVNTTATALRTENEKTNKAILDRNRAIDDGTYRMRLKTTCPVPAATDTAIASGDNSGEARTELDAETGKTLFAIAEEGDRAIRKLNACIDLYNNAMESQKGKP